MRRLLLVTIILAAAGVVVSAYSLRQHYASFGAAFCNVSERFSCDLVNKSTYSEILGIPVALIGIVGYVVLAGLAFAAYKRVFAGKGNDSSREAPMAKWERGWGIRELLSALLVAAVVGLAFSLYLTSIELFVIGAICILCVTSQALIIAITILSVVLYRRSIAFVVATTRS